MYRVLLKDVHNVYNHKWITSVKSVLDGCRYIWLSQCSEIANTWMLRTIINTRLNDQYLQLGYTYIDSSSKASSYKLLKKTVIFETYLSLLEKTILMSIIMFKALKPYFPIETGRWKNVLLQTKICPLCSNSDIRDEFLYILYLCV